MATEIHRISFTNLRRHGAAALKFVSEERGHLWVTFHGKPACAIISMNDERILHRALGLDPNVAMHRALIDADRMASAINERRMQMVMPDLGGYPQVGLDDETYRAWKKEGRLINPVSRRVSTEEY